MARTASVKRVPSSSDTGRTGHKRRDGKPEPTDEFLNVSKYLCTIFARNGIPRSLLSFSLMLAQRMDAQTNQIYLFKPMKDEFSEIMDITFERVNQLIQQCRKYDLIRPYARGMYMVNSYLFTACPVSEIRGLQTEYDKLVLVAPKGCVIDGKAVQEAASSE